ncbi:unnamed protein product [Linum tenue]|uniref:Bromo domain-containing protein n=1 Tax=Linum tenue TaxID=586396 RepID=A0AAV0NFU3_9ROSI|nr:unnamed protein product [Linum tenue]
MEITASANSSAPVRKFLNLNSSKRDTFGVPTQVLSPAQMSSLERKDMIRRLRSELELVRDVQKNIVVERGVGNVSSSNRVLNVDVVKLNIPDYFTIVKHPMDLGTIKSRIMSGLYSSPLEFAEDVRLTFSNAMLYNPKGNDVHIMAESLKKFFEVRWKSIDRKLPKKLLNVSGPSNSSLQQQRVNDLADEDVDIGENEPPVSSYPPVEIASDIGCESNRVMSSGSSRDSGGSSEVESDHVKPSSRSPVSKVLDDMVRGGQTDEKKIGDHPLDRTQSDSGLDQLEENSEESLGQIIRMVIKMEKVLLVGVRSSPHKDYRAAMIRNRFSDMILKAREEKTLLQVDKVDPDKLQKEREKLRVAEKERRKRGYKLKQRLPKMPGSKRKAAAAAEARRLLEVEREAARQALLKVERTVEINENSKFLEDLEMLRSAPAEQVPSSVDEVSPDNSPDGLGGFKFGGDSNPLEQLGLFRKDDEEEEEGEPLSVPQESFKFGGDSNPLEQLGLFRKDDEVEEEGEPLSVPQEMNDVEPEEGEID